MPRRARNILALIAATLVLTGCSFGPPASAPSTSSGSPSSASSNPSPEEHPSAIVISGDRVSLVTSAGTTVGSATYAQGSGAIVSLLSATLGEPSTTYTGSECVDPYRSTGWGESADASLPALEVRTESAALVPGITAWVVANAATVDGLALRASAGFAVGDPISSVTAKLDKDQLAGAADNAVEGAHGHGYVFDTAGTVDVDGTATLYGGATADDAGIVVVIGAPRTAQRQGC